ncbi:MAG: type 1 secretion system HlyD family membrane fusion component [Rhodobacteraceae bacterium HLUCCA08]|nr:MAG: type 1 secretion system HlyD family membrane fusion component [Rhodobacteraceae bacterium HLUCCA08]
MAKVHRRTRLWLALITLALVAGAITLALWPRPMMVDFAAVTEGPMEVTIDEEGRTRVGEAYVVSAPVSGTLLRVSVQPGDPVRGGETVVAHMRPSDPVALDIRTREQARAAVVAAEAALRLAEADLLSADAADDLARSDLERTERLAASGTASQAALDRARGQARSTAAMLETARAAIAMRQAELQSARATLIGFDDQGLARALEPEDEDIPLLAPADGRILRLFQQSETAMGAGTPILEIGDIAGDLEVVAELLSSDAVQVAVGDPVRIEDWGGPDALAGTVARIDPVGVTRVSALGVEEQRVTVVVALTDPPEARAALGHGYRVEARIVVWQAEAALIAPNAALFRHEGGWAVFRAADGAARLTPVGIGRMNGTQAEVLAGLQAGDRIVLYPSAALTDGQAVTQRIVE